MKAGRNEPCPCGSGKKYKHCCMQAAADPADLLWRRLRRLHDDLPLRLLKFADRTFGEQALLEAWDEFYLWEGPEFDPVSPKQQLFMPWFFFHWTPDPEETEVEPDAPRDTPVVRAYLDRHGRTLDELERRYLEAALRAAFSFHDVLACTPQQGFVLRDIFTGEEHEVRERLGSTNVERGDILLAKVVELDGLKTLDGIGPLVIPPGEKAPVLALRKQMKLAGVPITADFVRDYDLEIFDIYHALDEALTNPAPPELRNTDGDPLEFHKLVYDIDSPQAAFDALKPLALDAEGDTPPADAERDDSGALRSVSFTWSKRGNKMHKHWDNTILGHLHIEDRTLTVEVNSARRARKFRKLADPLLGAAGRHRETIVEAVEAALARAAAGGAHRAPAMPSESSPELQAHVAEFVRAHYDQWAHDKLPVLGNRTPLQAMKDPEGRELVEALLLDIERDRQHLGLPGESPATRLRERLGLVPGREPAPDRDDTGEPTRRRRKSAKAAKKEVFQIKVTLKHVAPAVWRRIQVPVDVRLDRLHEVLQHVMGWTDSHLHGFYVGRTAYGRPDPEFPDDTLDERRVRLDEIAGEGDTVVYEYDFGDGWRHSLKIEKRMPAEPGARYPRCLAGKRACPPEDCGGPPGYARLLEVLADPKHEEHEDMLDWLGGDFDAEAFDPGEVDRALR